MTSLIITLHTPTQGPVDLELPGDVSLQSLLPALVQALQLPAADSAGQQIQYQLYQQRQQRGVREAATLMGAGVVTGDTLTLIGNGLGSGSIESIAGHSQAMLRCTSRVIALDNYGKTELTLGRYDARTGQMPDIDLSEEPNGNTVSRSHALLCKQNGQWALVALDAKNSTQVGGKNLAAKTPQVLKPGDVIMLGGVTLRFEN